MSPTQIYILLVVIAFFTAIIGLNSVFLHHTKKNSMCNEIDQKQNQSYPVRTKYSITSSNFLCKNKIKPENNNMFENFIYETSLPINTSFDVNFRNEYFNIWYPKNMNKTQVEFINLQFLNFMTNFTISKYETEIMYKIRIHKMLICYGKKGTFPSNKIINEDKCRKSKSIFYLGTAYDLKLKSILIIKTNDQNLFIGSEAMIVNIPNQV